MIFLLIIEFLSEIYQGVNGVTQGQVWVIFFYLLSIINAVRFNYSSLQL